MAARAQAPSHAGNAIGSELRHQQARSPSGDGGIGMPSQPLGAMGHADGNLPSGHPLDERVDTHIEDIFADGKTFGLHAPVVLPSVRRAPLAWLTGVVSVVLHASVAFAILYIPFAETGLAPIPSDAVNLEISISNFVQQSTATSVDEPSAAVSAISPDEGDIDSIAAADVAEPVTAKAPTETAPSVIAGSAPEADFSANKSRVIALKAEPLDVEEVEEKPEETKAVTKPKVRKEAKKPTDSKKRSDIKVKQPDKGEQTATRKKGGRTATGTSQSGRGGRAAASAGSIAGYAARVRARVFSNRPSGGGAHGVATVSFAVSRSGGLSYVHLARSSGNAALDRAALSAVRRAAPFPPPPGGTAPRFSIPFTFR